MKGLELSLKYFDQIGKPLLQDQFSSEWDRIAAGAVGRGSDYFGFDDEYSRDHNWGPGFCLWLSDSDMKDFGMDLAKAYTQLPREFCGYPCKALSSGQVGVFSVGQFYQFLLGPEVLPLLDHQGITESQWSSIPEENLACAVNGRVFQDSTGNFSAIRNSLLQYYPEKLQREKLSSYCREAGTAGQFSYIRSLCRGEIMAANGSLQRFSEAICRIVHVLNRRFCPDYRWLHRGISLLPILGQELFPLLKELADCSGSYWGEPLSSVARQQADRIEQISQLVCRELCSQGFSTADDCYLSDHSLSILQI